MTFPLSAGVYFDEIDLTAGVTGVSSTAAAISGIFSWGPVNLPTLVGSANTLKQTFGSPSNLNAETWFSGANFLGYGNALWVCRTANTTANGASNTAAPNTAVNAVANTANIVNILNNVVLNRNTFSTQEFTDTNVLYIAKYPGALGNSLRIAQCDSPNAYSSNVSFSGTIVSGISAGNSYLGTLTVNVGANTGQLVITASGGSNVSVGNTFAQAIISNFTVGDNMLIGNNTIGSQASNMLKITGISNAVTNSTATLVTFNFATASRLPQVTTANTVRRFWEFYNYVQGGPGLTPSVQALSGNSSLVDQLSIVIVDQNGGFSGVPGTIIETWNNLSFATDATNQDGSSAFYQTVLNQSSKYVWAVNSRSGVTVANSATLVNSTDQNPLSLQFQLGQDGDSESVAPLSTLANGWGFFTNKLYPISLIIAGKSIGGSGTFNGVTYNNFQLTNWLVQNIVNLRGNDCVVCSSPDKSTVVNNAGQEAMSIYGWTTFLNPSTYLIIDTGYKYQYDQYNNIYRWIPMNGDVAGCCAYTDLVAYPWFSPAGVKRGLIQNATRLAYNPSETDRDFLYPLAINPIINEAGWGTYLDGDRTFTIQTTAFNRINVRRLFIYLEQSIVNATKIINFELNDVFTQNEFKNIVNPFLKNVQGARGLYDFIVICDSSNNTAFVVDSNEFLAGIYLKPARAINFIRLDFVAVSDSVSFSEVESSQF